MWVHEARSASVAGTWRSGSLREFTKPPTRTGFGSKNSCQSRHRSPTLFRVSLNYAQFYRQNEGSRRYTDLHRECIVTGHGNKLVWFPKCRQAHAPPADLPAIIGAVSSKRISCVRETPVLKVVNRLWRFRGAHDPMRSSPCPTMA